MVTFRIVLNLVQGLAGVPGQNLIKPLARLQDLPGMDIDIHAREILKARERLNEILARHTGQSLDKIQHDTERDHFLGSEEAQEYGLIDAVLTQRSKMIDAQAGTK